MHLHRGMGLIDVLVGTGLFLVIFLGLFGILRASLEVASLARARAAATAIASSQLEYVRSLDYDAIGTVGGIPAGAIAQTATTTQAGFEFGVRTYIAYVDDPQDGEGVADANGITTDYKVVKITVSYAVKGISREVLLVSNAVPPGIETTEGGGTLRIDVVDAQGNPVPGATVRVVNANVSPAVDLSTFSDASGTVLLGGAATSTDYEIEVTKSGYSSAQTYERNATNQNPTPGYLTVAESQTTTGTFAIDLLGTLTVRTFSPIEANAFVDGFDDSSYVVDTDATVISGSALILSGGAGAYVSSGDALATTTAPTYLASWTSATYATSEPLGTAARFQIVDSTGTLLPEAVLPGNSAGFSGQVDLSGISTTTYPALALRAELTSADPLVTPSIFDWRIDYEEGPLPLPNVAFDLTGAKTIGSMGDGTPLYKTEVATTTDSTGVRSMTLEWDSYDLSVTGYTIQAQDPLIPYELLPGGSVNTVLILAP